MEPVSAVLAAVFPMTVGQGSSPKTFSQFPLNLSETPNTGKSHLHFFSEVNLVMK